MSTETILEQEMMAKIEAGQPLEKPEGFVASQSRTNVTIVDV